MANDPADLPAPPGPEDAVLAPERTPAPPDGDIRVVDRRWWARGADAASAADDRSSDKPSYVRELEDRLAAKDEELRATIAKYREAANEFDEMRLRIRKDVARDLERSKRAMLADLLEVVDNLERAIDAGRQSGADGPLLQGVVLVHAQFLAKLDGLGVRKVDALGAGFDPTVHEAAAAVPVTDPGQDGRVVGVIRPGYAIGDDMLRPAVVAVARFDPEGVPS